MGISREQAVKIRREWSQEIADIAVAVENAGFSDQASELKRLARDVAGVEKVRGGGGKHWRYINDKLSLICQKYLSESAAVGDQLATGKWLARYQAIEMLRNATRHAEPEPTF